MANRIEHFITMGDSLSDRKTFYNRKLFGFIPLGKLTLDKVSSKGRFTNGFVWDDEFSTFIAEDAIIKDLKHKGLDSTDIGDGILAHDSQVEKPLHDNFNLDHDTYVNYKHQDLIRNYNEGGLTSYDYSHRVTTNLKLLATEKILSTLDKKRQLLLEDDAARKTSEDHKKKTLVIEWSGANDLITINTEPTKEEAEKAVLSRIHNVEELIKNGYRNFALFNLPDLSLTPRFQRKGGLELQNAHDISMYFNQRLAEEAGKLALKYKDCSVDVFDINKTFTDVYHNPVKYGFDPEKIHQPLTEMKGFNKDTSTSDGAMFFDDVHPAAELQAMLGNEFYKEYHSKYHIVPSHESLLNVFKEQYRQKFEDDRRGYFGFFRSSNIGNLDNATLESILKHALHNGGNRTREIIIQLGWIDNQGNLVSDNPVLQKAMENVQENHQHDMPKSCW